MDLSERRQHFRYIAWLPAVVAGQGCEAQPATVVDISSGGALVEVALPIENGCAVRLLVRHRGESVAIEGSVVGSSEGPGWLLNLQFEDEQTPDAVDAIEDVISRLAA